MIWRQLKPRSTHTNATCCAALLANTCVKCRTMLHRERDSMSSAFICCREQIRNLRTLKMRLAGASIGASRQRGDHYLLLKVGRDALGRRLLVTEIWTQSPVEGRAQIAPQEF